MRSLRRITAITLRLTNARRIVPQRADRGAPWPGAEAVTRALPDDARPPRTVVLVEDDYGDSCLAARCGEDSEWCPWSVFLEQSEIDRAAFDRLDVAHAERHDEGVAERAADLAYLRGEASNATPVGPPA